MTRASFVIPHYNAWPPLHHNYEIGNASLFVSMGRIRRAHYLDGGGNVKERWELKVTYTFDDRIVDGIYSGKAMKLVQGFMSDPARLDEPPERGSD